MSKRDQQGVENGVFGGLGTPWEHPGAHLETNMAQGRRAQGQKRNAKVSYSPPEPGPKMDTILSKIVKSVFVFCVFLGS